jgi:hypothetical protein
MVLKSPYDTQLGVSAGFILMLITTLSNTQMGVAVLISNRSRAIALKMSTIGGL